MLQYVRPVEKARKQQTNGKRMQAQSFVLFVIVLIVETVVLEVNAKFKSSSKLPTRPDNSTELQPEVSGVQNRALIFIRNDGPTVFGSKTVFNVTVKAQPDLYLSFQWGTFIPYVWRNVRTYQYTESLEVDWWKSPGQKTIYFYIDALKRNSSKWNRIAQNSSSVQVIGMASRFSFTLHVHYLYE